MRLALHVLPHPGGGAETYIDILGGMEGWRHERVTLSPSRSRLRGAASVPIRRPRIASRARSVDLVHVHGDTAAMLSVPILRRAPSVITTHGLHRVRRRSRPRLGERAITRAVGAASLVICTSAAERDELREIVPPELQERLLVIPNGVPLPAETPADFRASARAGLGIEDDRLVVLFLGRLEARKEPLVAAEAAERAAANGAKLELLVAGDGPLAHRLAERSSAAVRPLGFRRDVERLYAAADAFVLPSRREGMSMALLTAMSRGLAVVVAGAPGSAEAVGEAGLLVAPDSGSLADAFARLAADHGERARLGEAARRRIGNELSDARFQERTMAAYERALEGAQASTLVSGPGSER